jgi:hypothetical protein
MLMQIPCHVHINQTEQAGAYNNTSGNEPKLLFMLQADMAHTHRSNTQHSTL